MNGIWIWNMNGIWRLHIWNMNMFRRIWMEHEDVIYSMDKLFRILDDSHIIQVDDYSWLHINLKKTHVWFICMIVIWCTNKIGNFIGQLAVWPGSRGLWPRRKHTEFPPKSALNNAAEVQNHAGSEIWNPLFMCLLVKELRCETHHVPLRCTPKFTPASQNLRRSQGFHTLRDFVLAFRNAGALTRSPMGHFPWLQSGAPVR